MYLLQISLTGLGAECFEDDECDNVENSKCEAITSSSAEDPRKSCQCRKGFVHFKDECLKEGKIHGPEVN